MDNRYPHRKKGRTVTSWPAIIICFIIPPLIPVAIILLLVKFNNYNKRKNMNHGHRYVDENRNSGHIYDSDDRDSYHYEYETHHTTRNGRERKTYHYEYETTPSRDKHERKSSGKASFIVSMVFFFVGGLILISGIENFLNYWDFDGVLTTSFIGICFAAVGLYLLRLPRFSLHKRIGLSKFIVSMSFIFVGGLIILAGIEDVFYYSDFDGILSTTFIGICFAGVGFYLMRPWDINGSRNSLYQKYLSYVGNQRAVAVSDIASAVSVSLGKAYSDLQKMINLGYFGQSAILDRAVGYLLMDTDAYNEIPIDADEVNDEDAEHHIDKDEFTSILREIRAMGDNIVDPIVSEQIDRLESIAGKIFRAVEEDPDKRPQIQRFLDYYLPTTLKLIKTYSQLERQGERGENITNAKIKIEDIIEELVSGYEKLLDRLYQEDILDISSDIEVLETMMAKDGYSDKNKIQIDNKK